MTVYEIYTDTFEFRMGSEKSKIPVMTAEEIFDTYQSCDDRITSNFLCPKLEAQNDEKVDATEIWNEYFANYGSTQLQKGQMQYLLTGRLAYMVEAEYDDDGEFVQELGVLCISAEPYKGE